MNLPICAKCKKRPAAVFITKLENGNKVNEGLCFVCAHELGIKPLDNMLKQMGGIVKMYSMVNVRNYNIVVTSVDRTDYYETLTEEGFKSDILPQLEARGYKMLGSALVQQWGSGNALITELIYWAEHNGADVYQVVLIVNSGSRTYIVCLSSPDGNSEALSNLYYTLTATDY